jgi:ABC-type Fe3+ transport system permease subunit
MTTALNLINFEQLANTLFLIATFYSFASGNQATQSILEKQQGTPLSGSTSSAEKSAQFAFIATSLTAAAYIIFTLVSVARRNQLEKDILAGTSNTSVTPTSNIALGFAIALIGGIIRLPAIQQRIKEAQAVIL